MSTIAGLLRLADLYATAVDVPPSTVSSRVFDDGKVLDRLRQGGDLTTGRAARAVEWFDANWPAELDWPDIVARPSLASVAA